MTKSNNSRLPFSKHFEKVRENLFFVLVEPEIKGNIGASARAIKTCGFKNLILVNPQINPEQPETRWMAHQSEDILDNAQMFPTFSKAIGDKRLVIATTQRKRHFKFPLYTPEDISEKISEVALTHPVAIVFGRERTGLTNEELVQCHIHSTIITATSQPSLNLAQAVMIYAHTFFLNQNVKGSYYKYDLASQRELQFYYDHLQKSLEKVGFVPRDSMESFVTRFKRLIGRSLAEKRDVRMLHKILEIFEKRIDDLKSQIPNELEEEKKIY